MMIFVINDLNVVLFEMFDIVVVFGEVVCVLLILFVDDELNVLLVFRCVFWFIGYDIVMVDSGEVVFEILVLIDIDLIVFDMWMLYMSGVEFLVCVWVLYFDMMCILLIGYVEIVLVVQVVNEGGVYCYLNKLWDDYDLLLIIEQVLEQCCLCCEVVWLVVFIEVQNDVLCWFNIDFEMQVCVCIEEFGQIVMFFEVVQSDLKSSFIVMVQVCVSMIELCCGVVSGYVMWVGEIVWWFVLVFGMSELYVQDVYFVGLLYGIGKLLLLDELLYKLFVWMMIDEYCVFQEYLLCVQMVLMLVVQLYKVVLIVLYQYECFNGCGMLDGLVGDVILVGLWIVVIVCDFEGLCYGEIGVLYLIEQVIDVLCLQVNVCYDL